MYRSGHLGVALLVYAPVGFLLLVSGRADLALLGEVCMLGLASLPDYDQRIPLVKHRGITHTLAFALAVGGVLGAVGWVVGGRPEAFTSAELAVFGFVFGTLAIIAHLLGDVITPAGIAPFWPLSGRNYSFRLARADNVLANYGLLALGVFATVALLALYGRVL